MKVIKLKRGQLRSNPEQGRIEFREKWDAIVGDRAKSRNWHRVEREREMIWNFSFSSTVDRYDNVSF